MFGDAAVDGPERVGADGVSCSAVCDRDGGAFARFDEATEDLAGVVVDARRGADRARVDVGDTEALGTSGESLVGEVAPVNLVPFGGDDRRTVGVREVLVNLLVVLPRWRDPQSDAGHILAA